MEAWCRSQASSACWQLIRSSMLQTYGQVCWLSPWIGGIRRLLHTVRIHPPLSRVGSKLLLLGCGNHCKAHSKLDLEVFGGCANALVARLTPARFSAQSRRFPTKSIESHVWGSVKSKVCWEWSLRSKICTCVFSMLI
jgi:hypothetical protein